MKNLVEQNSEDKCNSAGLIRHLRLFSYSTDEDELRLGWTNPNQQQHHHHHHHQHNHPPDQHHHHQQQPAGHTGPRQHRSKQHREQQRPRAPDRLNGQPQPGPRRPAQVGDYGGSAPGSVQMTL